MPNEDGANPNAQTPEIVNPVDTQNPAGDGAKDTGTPDGGQPTRKKYKNQLPDDLKDDVRLDKYDSLGDAIRDLLNGSEVKTAEGGDKGEKPKDEGQSQEDVQYTFTKKFSEDVDSMGILDKNLTEAIKTLKLPQAQADAVYGSIVDAQTKALDDLRTKGSQLCEAKLKDMWGDKYDAKMAAMKRAYGMYVQKDSPLEKGLKATQAENNPYVAALFAQLGEAIRETTPPFSAAVGGGNKPSGGFINREGEKYPW